MAVASTVAITFPNRSGGVCPCMAAKIVTVNRVETPITRKLSTVINPYPTIGETRGRRATPMRTTPPEANSNSSGLW